MVIVSGIHRSGTTFLSKLINVDNIYSSIHEPLNLDYGIKENSVWYPYVSENNLDEPNQILDDFINGKFDFKVPNAHKREIIRRLFKSRGNLDYLKHKLMFPGRELLIKDPFAVLSSNYFLHHSDQIKVIFTIRHPAAVFRSINRMNWDFNFSNSDLEKIISDYPNFNQASKNNKVERLCLLWNIIYRVVYEQLLKYPNKTILVKHEDLSINPNDEMKRICNFLTIDFSENMSRFIETNMFEETINPDHNKQFDFKRNSSELAYSWRSESNEEYEKIISLTKDTLDKFGY